jgi:hypothetical protein
MMKPLRKILLTTLGLFPMMAPMDSARAAEASEGTPDYMASASELPWRKARLSLEAQTGTRTIGTIDALIPFMGNDDLIIYADLMAKAATDKAFEGNLGLGFRRVNDAETAIFGMYAFYDILKSVNNNQFTQVTVGAERLGLTWDFRANAYLPVGKTKYNKTIYAGGSTQIVDHNIIEYVKSQDEQARVGADVEMGRTLGTNKVRGYLAMYTFGENLTGPRTRVEYQLNSHVTLNAAVQYDQTRKTQYFVGARFTVGGAKTSNSDSIYARLTDPVVRDIDIITKSTTTDTTQIANNKFWMVDQSKTTPGGSGTVTDPYSSIEQAIEMAPNGAIIYVKGADGVITQVAKGTTLKPGQMLVGGDQSVYFDFKNNQARFSQDDNSLLLMNGNGIRPTISGTLIANSNVGFYNLNLIANSLVKDYAGITITNAQGVILSGINVSGFNAQNGAGILVSEGSQVSISNFTSIDNYIGMDIQNSDVAITNTLNLDRSQFAALQLVNSEVTVDAASITNSVANGIIAFNSHLAVKNDLTINGGATGIWAQAGSTITANNATVTNSNVLVDAAQLNITNALAINAENITLQNGGVVNANTATVNAGSMLFNQGNWLSKNSVVTIKSSDAIALWLQNNSQVNFNTLTISGAKTSVQVESDTGKAKSNLTISDTLTSDHHIVINNAIINAANAHLTNGDILLNQGTLKVAKELTLDADATHQISVINKSELSALAATISTGSLLVDNSNLTLSSGTSDFISNITIQNSGNTDFGASTVTTQANISVNGADSLLTSTGTVTAEQDIMITAGIFAGQVVNANSNIVVTGGALGASDGLTVDATETKKIAIKEGGVLDAGFATITTGTILIDGIVGDNKSLLQANGGSITANSIAVTDFAQLVTEQDTNLVINGLTLDSFTIKGGAQIDVANTTINNSNVMVDGTDSLLKTKILTVAKTSAAEQATDPIIYQLAVTDGGVITALNAASKVNINKVILTDGTIHLDNGTLTVDGSTADADGVAMTQKTGISLLTVNNLTVTNSTLNGINLSSGTINAGTITTSNNKSDGILVNGGTITSTGLVTSKENGSNVGGEGDHGSIGHGLSVNNDGEVIFNSLTAMGNLGDGINQSGGTITTSNTGKVTLSGNTYHTFYDEGGNGMVKTGGITTFPYQVTIDGNEKMGLSISDVIGTDANFTAKNLTITNNKAVGIFLEKGKVTFSDITVNSNNVDANGDYANQIIVRGTDGQRELNILIAVDGSTISSGKTSILGDQKSRSAVLIDSDATVVIQHATISDNTNGYGIWVDAGDVTLNDLTSEKNQRAVVFTQGTLTINTATISNNTEYGIVAQNLDDKTTATRELTLNNVDLSTTGKLEGSLSGAGYGLAVRDATKVTYIGGDITDNAAGGVYLANSKDLTLDHLLIQNNVGNGIDVINSNTPVTLNITNTQINNKVAAGETPQQKIGLNIDVQSLDLTLDNTQVTNNQADGINLTTTNDITMNIQNGSEISSNKGAGLIADSKLGSVNLTMSKSDVNGNNNHGINLIVENNSLNVAVNANLTNVNINDNGQNNNTYGLYIYQKFNVLKTIVNLTDVSILNNKNYGVVVAQGAISGMIEGNSHIQTQNILNVKKNGDWAKPLPT